MRACTDDVDGEKTGIHSWMERIKVTLITDIPVGISDINRLCTI